MLSRLSKDDYFLEMLKLVAARSTCVRRAVGAIITDSEGHVLSTGYNGVPKDFDHCNEGHPCLGIIDKPGDTSNCMAIHAETNAIIQCGDRLIRAHTIYCTCTPCFSCAKMLANTDIQHVICEQAYADIKGLTVLLERGMRVVIDGKEIAA